MNKEEIIESILYRMSDPWAGDVEEDIALCDPIDLPYATELLSEIRQEDIDNANDDDYRMPNAATPELVMEAFNCRIRLAKRNITIERIAETITKNDETALYSNYRGNLIDLGYMTSDEAKDIVPLDFLDEEFIFDPNLPIMNILTIVKKSGDCFNPNFEYCWYDYDNKILHSTDNPFESGILNATAFATFILDYPDLISMYIHGYLDKEEAEYVFKYMPDLLDKE